MTAKALLEKYGIKPNKCFRPKVDGPGIEDRELQEKIYDEGAGKKSKIAEQNQKIARRAADINKEKGSSRNDLMLKAKEKGIKNYRILNKQELNIVLQDGIDAERINGIVAIAVKRWKQGWGTREKVNV